jgi:hypothetical protein
MRSSAMRTQHSVWDWICEVVEALEDGTDAPLMEVTPDVETVRA